MQTKAFLDRITGVRGYRDQIVRAGLRYSRKMRDLQEQMKTGGQPTPLMPPEESDTQDD